MIKRSPFNANAARFRVNRDPRGYITTGKKSEKGLPQSLSYFDLTGFPELQAVYGTEPTELIIVLPTNDITDFFDDSFASWGKKGAEATKRRHCDGESCVHRIEETVDGVTYGRGEVSACVCEGLEEGDKLRCSYGAILKVFIATPDSKTFVSPVCYGFRTGSINSGQSIKSELEKIAFLARMQSGGDARIAGYPLRLSVRMIGGKDDARQKFPIWNLTAMTFNIPSLPSPAGAESATLALGSGEEREPDSEIVATAPAVMVAEIDRMGKLLFPETWDAKRREAAIKISIGETGLIEELSEEQAAEIAVAFQARLAEKAGEVAT